MFAAIEGLCRGGSIAVSTAACTQFQFNTSYPSTINATIGEPGYLTWMLSGSNFNLSEPMGLSINPVSNVALDDGSRRVLYMRFLLT